MRPGREYRQRGSGPAATPVRLQARHRSSKSDAGRREVAGRPAAGETEDVKAEGLRLRRTWLRHAQDLARDGRRLRHAHPGF